MVKQPHNPSLTRRSFIKRSALAAGAFSAVPMFTGLNILAADAGKKLNCVQIGCGGRGLSSHIDWVINHSEDNLVAIVDPDEKRHAEVKRVMKRKELDADKLQVFTDYRVMFDRIGKHIDAVFIATPNHHHALASMLAMNLGKPVYCEKPLTHDIAEARKLRQMARKSKAPTQMGNQGHCMDGYRSLWDLIWSREMGHDK